MKKYIFITSLVINLVFVLFIIRHFINLPKIESSKDITYNHQRNKVLDKLLIDSNAIVFGGDSHIQQFELAEIFHSLSVKNRGIDYDTSLGLLNRVDELTKGHPSKIFIEIGANDLSQKISLDSIENNIKSILNAIHNQSPKSIVYLQSIIPNKYTLQEILILNKKFRLIATTNQATFIDLNPYFLDTDTGLKKQYDSGDGVHLNGEGYLKWGTVLRKYL